MVVVGANYKHIAVLGNQIAVETANNGALFGRKINEIVLAAGEKNLRVTLHSIAIDVFRRGAAQLGPTSDVSPAETTRLHKDIFALI